MDGSKKWWKSKGVWTGIVTVVIALYQLVDANLGPNLGFDLPTIPDWIYAILGTIGVYARSSATKKIE